MGMRLRAGPTSAEQGGPGVCILARPRSCLSRSHAGRAQGASWAWLLLYNIRTLQSHPRYHKPLVTTVPILAPLTCVISSNDFSCLFVCFKLKAKLRYMFRNHFLFQKGQDTAGRSAVFCSAVSHCRHAWRFPLIGCVVLSPVN